jgi:hypothetical protein
LESYFDGSSDTGAWRKGDLVTLAGFAADDSVWAEFDAKWRNALKGTRQRPEAPYLHMREATKGKGPFTYKNGWNLKKVGFLVTDLLTYMQTVDKKRFRQFGCTVDLEAYRKLTAQGYLFNDPVDICNEFCPFSVLAWYHADYPGIIHSAHYFFDVDEPFKVPFEERWKSEKGNFLDPTAVREVWSLIKTVTTGDMRDKPALQAADLLAWSSNRTRSKNPDAAFKHLEPIMKQIIPSTWIVFDERTLTDRYEFIKKGAKFRVIPGRYGVY